MLQQLQQQSNYFLWLSAHDLEHISNPKKVIEDLIALIKEHNVLYYLKASPIISDSQYDILFDLLKRLEQQFPQFLSANSPTQHLLGQIDAFQKSPHRVPLLSLMNTYSADDIQDRGKSLQNTLDKRGDGNYSLSYCIEPKLDGNAVEIIYKDGIFLSASTRGDGNIGEDITEHAKYLLWLPLVLSWPNIPSLLSLRGEIIMSKQAHTRLNEYQSQEGLPLFANPRNAVAGTLRNLDPKMVQYRGLTVIFYDVLYAEWIDFSSQSMMYSQLQDYGLPVIEKISVANSIGQVQELCVDSKVFKHLEKQWYETDGLVIKLDDIPLRSILGTTNHHPRRAMAYKFPSKQIVTKLLSVSFQIGRTGVITPVAELEPVQLGGVLISRASLHNFDQIQTLDIRLWDSVWIQRSGEVIPYVLWPLIELRQGHETNIITPLVCPVCGQNTEKDAQYVAVRCSNTLCPAVIKESLAHAVSKDCLDLQGLGYALIALLVDAGLIHTLWDLFLLSQPQYTMQLRLLPWLAGKKIKQILEAIESTKILPFWRWLHAFGIDGVWVKTAQELEQWLAQQHISWATNILEAFALFQSSTLHGFGKGWESHLQCYARLQENKELWQFLEQQGVLFLPRQQSKQTGFLSGKSIVITGTFDVPRSQLITLIEQAWGKVVEGVTKKVSAFLVWANPGTKAEKAEKMWIPAYTSFDELKKTT